MHNSSKTQHQIPMPRFRCWRELWRVVSKYWSLPKTDLNTRQLCPNCCSDSTFNFKGTAFSTNNCLKILQPTCTQKARPVFRNSRVNCLPAQESQKQITYLVTNSRRRKQFFKSHVYLAQKRFSVSCFMSSLTCFCVYIYFHILNACALPKPWPSFFSAQRSEF